MDGHGKKLEHKREQAIAALLTQRNVEEAARSVDIGVSEAGTEPAGLSLRSRGSSRALPQLPPLC